MVQRYYDAPEVVSTHEHNAPEVAYEQGLEADYTGKEALVPADPSPYILSPYKGYNSAGIPVGTEKLSSPKICGIRKRWFWVLVLAAFVVGMGAIGAGIGVALSAKNSNKTSGSTRTETTPGAATVSTASSTTALLATTTITATVAVATDMSGCPLVNGTIFTGPSGATFKKICYYDILASGNDIKGISSVTTFDSCIGLCDSYNVANGGTTCKSVVWDMTGSYYQDCWLKNSTSVLMANGVVGAKNSTVAAIRQ